MTSLKLFIFSSLVMAVFILTFFVNGEAGECWVDTENRPVTWYCPASEKNYQRSNRTGYEIDFIIIHTVQGLLNSAVNTFQSGKLDYPRSAHYTIGKDGKVVKSVDPHDIAWHAGTSPIGSGKRFESHILNDNSIGIEHAGFVDDPDFPTLEQYITSAGLVRLLCAQYDIPIDREHIVGHNQIKSTKQDPGPNWDWGFYLQLVKYGSTKAKTGSETKAKEYKPGILPKAWSISMIVGAAFAVFLSLLLLNY